MDLGSERRGDVTIVSVPEQRLDATVAIQFKDALRRASDGADGPVVLDLGAVDFLDSSGLGALVASMRHLGSDRPLILARPLPPVERVLRLTRMDRVFPLCPDLDSAVAWRPAGA